MKAITTILVAILLVSSARAGYIVPCKLGGDFPDPPAVQTGPGPKMMLEIIVAGTVVVIGGWLYFKIRQQFPTGDAPVTLVLEYSEDHSHWTPVATNTVVLHNMDPQDVFAAQIDTTKKNGFYQVRKI